MDIQLMKLASSVLWLSNLTTSFPTCPLAISSLLLPLKGWHLAFSHGSGRHNWRGMGQINHLDNWRHWDHVCFCSGEEVQAGEQLSPCRALSGSITQRWRSLGTSRAVPGGPRACVLTPLTCDMDAVPVTTRSADRCENASEKCCTVSWKSVIYGWTTNGSSAVGTCFFLSGQCQWRRAAKGYKRYLAASG